MTSHHASLASSTVACLLLAACSSGISDPSNESDVTPFGNPPSSTPSPAASMPPPPASTPTPPPAGPSPEQNPTPAAPPPAPAAWQPPASIDPSTPVGIHGQL